MTWETGLLWFFFAGTVVLALVFGFAGGMVALAKDAAGKRRPLTVGIGLLLLLVAGYCASVALDLLR